MPLRQGAEWWLGVAEERAKTNGNGGNIDQSKE
jgi:hypothetical protein